MSEVLKRHQACGSWFFANRSQIVIPWGASLGHIPKSKLLQSYWLPNRRYWLPDDFPDFVGFTRRLYAEANSLKVGDMLVLAAARYLGAELGTNDKKMLHAASQLGLKTSSP